MNRLSGDQNGNEVSSVLGSGCAVSESSGRTHKRILPDASRAVNASVRPSGEIMTLVRPKVTPVAKVFSGGYTKNRVTDGRVERDVDHHTAAPAIAISANSAAAVACHTRSETGEDFRTAAVSIAVGNAVVSNAPSSARRASRMSPIRCFG